MKKIVNGIYVEMTQEEIEAASVEIAPQPITVEERIEALESALLEVVLNG